VPSTEVVTASGGSVASSDGSVTLVFGANTVTSPVTVIHLTRLSPSQALQDGRDIVRDFELEARAGDGRQVTQFNQPYTMTVIYTDAELAALGLDEASLNVAFWNGNVWEGILPCAGCSVDTINNRLTLVLDHFTEFVLAGMANSSTTDYKTFLPLIQR
jgi:hypothetical protein